MSAYSRSINKVYEPLDKSNEQTLYVQMKNGDQSARNTIIYSCLPLVYSVAQKFYVNNKHISLEDMVQEGNIALLKAVDNWDIEKGKITTVATMYVRNALVDMIKKSKYSITTKMNITKQASEDIIKIKNAKTSDIEEIKEKTKLKEKRIKQLLSIMKGKRVDFEKLKFGIKENKDQTETEANVNGCLADLISAINDYIEDEVEKKVFLSWVKNIKEHNKTRLVANETGVNYNDVKDIVKRVKKQLKEVVNA